MKQYLNWLVLAPLLVIPPGAGAEFVAERGAASLTVDAFVNTAVAGSEGEAAGREALAEGELRVLGLVGIQGETALGARIVYAADSDGPDKFGERSLLAVGRFGRFEAGRRRGLPDVLTGYAPNNYQFVSAEFGPASGRSLDPDGRLQTAFLLPQTGTAIDSLSSLGITSALFFDESPKAIYVSPKVAGFLGGISYAPDADDTAGEFGRLVQSGLTYEHYRGQDVWRAGATFASAEGEGATGDLRSISVGAGATLDDTLTLGVSASYNGDTGLLRVPGAAHSGAYGIAASVNYNTGPWTYGGFVQYARHEGDVKDPGDDRLHAAELGLSYRFSTQLRLFGAAYLYRLDAEGRNNAADGAVLLAGLRWSL